jgi:hypothetical protein
MITGMSRNIAVLSILFLCFAAVAIAQVSEPGLPLTFSRSVLPEAEGAFVTTPPDLEQLAARDAAEPVPYRFAEIVPVNLGIQNAGSTIILPDGMRVWRLTIHSPGALAITVYFDRFRMPDQGRLFVYNPIRTEVLGAFTRKNENSLSTFATSLIHGDKVTVEYNAPADMPLPDLRISEVAHAYRGVREVSGLKIGFGTSGKCQVNVACSEADAWRDQVRSIARIEIKRGSSVSWCTGSLMNNTRNDGTPYVLTADHCGRVATPSDISQWIFYFDYQSTLCPNPLKEPGYKSMTGATLVSHGGNSGSTGSDFFLVLLNSEVPDNYNVYYNGWSRDTEPSPSGIGIHHPQGDIKKISTYTSPLIPAYWSGCTVLAHWEVTWSATASGHGTTENGSSGSPIFDNFGRVVGTLTGGDSSCDTNDLNKPDYYGMFSYSWDKNGTDSSDVLKYWLDPINAGVTTLNGWAVGMKEQAARGSLEIYPNPVVTKLTISAPGMNCRNASVRILDVCGRMHMEKRIFRCEGEELNVGSLPAGLFILQLTDGVNRGQAKFIKREH